MGPGETDLDPPSRPNISSEGTDWPLNSPTAGVVDKQANRKSLRVRPSEYLENAEPLSPLNLSLQSPPLPTSPKMSLFHLFSRPKVERQRGYAEKGVDVSQPQPTKQAAASTPNLVVHVQPPANNELRAPTPMSLPSSRSKSPGKVTFKEPLPRDPAERRSGIFEPPPLFQAYPQSMKDGLLEVSDFSPQTVLHKTKGKKSKADTDGVGEDAMSYRTKKSAKSSFRHVGNGASVNVELPRKIFVLVTSGYLLQYAESGPSDRLPEKMLHLGKESAAFACDLLPGKHYVLQVSQAVDQEGVVIASSSSIFSKLGIRSAAAKRMTSGFLLVMPSGKEMESWMSALRQEIEHLGGKRTRPDAAVRPKTAETGTDLKKTPSQSHRYQVRRNPAKVTNVTSPNRSTAMASPTQAMFSLQSPTLSTFMVPSPTLSSFPMPSPSKSPKIEDEKEDDSDTATIDGIEMEASKLDEEGPKASPRKRRTSDTPSMSSSAVVSVEHQQLNNVRNSFSTTRTSHTSQAGTVVTAGGTSRTNSLAGSPPSPGLLVAETARDNVAPLKPQYRSMASAGYSINRRRSAVPLQTPRDGQTLPTLNTSPAKSRQSVISESPVAGQQFPFPPVTNSPPSRLTAAQSEPNLKAVNSTKEKHDSKVPMPPPIPADDGERPQSFVGDLPPPSTWSSTRLPTRRTSLMQTSPVQTSPVATPAEAPRAPELNKPKRMSFSMPLKINPSLPNNVSPPVNNRRRSQLGTPDAAGEQPFVHTLTAKVEPSKRISVSQYSSSSSLPSPIPEIRSTKRMSVSEYQSSPSLLTPDGRITMPKRSSISPSPSLPTTNGRQRSTSGARLSLFPSQFATPPEPPKRSSSAMAQTTTIQPNPTTLRRPTSMQVRSDHAPFLQSLRNSTGPLDGRAVPIRGMKPSRSATNVTILAQQTPSPSFHGLRFDTPTLSETEEADQATPLPERALSPRPGSRSGSRKGLRPRSSLPELDLGIPVVGLGPPAPPPSAPLPAPPPASRTASPTPVDGGEGNFGVGAGIDQVAGLGIWVS